MLKPSKLYVSNYSKKISFVENLNVNKNIYCRQEIKQQYEGVKLHLPWKAKVGEKNFCLLLWIFGVMDNKDYWDGWRDQAVQGKRKRIFMAGDNIYFAVPLWSSLLQPLDLG